MKELDRWMEITFVLIVIYLVLSHGSAFSSAITAISGLYNGAVRNLQGRS